MPTKVGNCVYTHNTSTVKRVVNNMRKQLNIKYPNSIKSKEWIEKIKSSKLNYYTTPQGIDNIKNLSTRMVNNNPINLPGVRKKISRGVVKWWANLDEAERRRRISIFKKAPLHIRGKTITSYEQYIIDLHIPKLIFNGNYNANIMIKFKDGRYKIPDFVVKGQKKIVEIGDTEYWHTKEEILQTTQKYYNHGYKCLYLTQDDLKDKNLKKRILTFIDNHDCKILEIKKINSRFDGYTYNLEVEDNHNYIANNIVISNCHHYMSEINKTFLKAGKYKKILALSATPERDDGAHIEFFKNCPIVYSYGQKEAIEDKILAPFKVINVIGHLTYMERQEYLKLQVAIESAFEHYGHNFHYVLECANQQGHPDWRARRLRSAFTKRRIMLQNATDKILKTVDIIDKYEPIAKTIIFNEFINCAEAIYVRLKKKGYKVDIEHSKLKSKERKSALEKFRSNETQILVTARTLDEGIDVPDCECIIITGGSSSKRQQIQRIGRGLRQQPGKIARVYQVYLNNTKDEDWVRGRMKDMRHINVDWR